MDSLINMSVDVLTEEALPMKSAASEYSDSYESDEELLLCCKVQYDAKLTVEAANDPLNAIVLKAYIKSRMDECALALGEVKWKETIESCEPVIVGQLLKLLSST